MADPEPDQTSGLPADPTEPTAQTRPGAVPAEPPPPPDGPPPPAEPPTASLPPRWTGSAAVPPPMPPKRRWPRRWPAGSEAPAVGAPTGPAAGQPVDPWADTPAPVDPWAGHDGEWPTPPALPPTTAQPPVELARTAVERPVPLPPTARPLTPFPSRPPAPPWARRPAGPPTAGPARPPLPPPARPQTRRPRRWLRWLRRLGVFGLLSVACCCGVPAVAGYPVLQQYPASVTLPEAVADLRLRDDSASRRTTGRLEDQLRDAHLLADEVFAAVYTDGDGKRVVVFGTTGLRVTPQADVEAELSRLSGEYGLNELERFDLGERGAHQRCGTGRADGATVVVCGWADHGSLVTVLLTRRSVGESAELVNRLREAVLTRG